MRIRLISSSLLISTSYIKQIASCGLQQQLRLSTASFSCRRLKSPQEVSWELTIPKSQGYKFKWFWFNQLKYHLHNNHKQQLMFVVLSRLWRIVFLQMLLICHILSYLRVYWAFNQGPTRSLPEIGLSSVIIDIKRLLRYFKCLLSLACCLQAITASWMDPTTLINIKIFQLVLLLSCEHRAGYVSESMPNNILATFSTHWLLQWSDLVDYLGLECQMCVPIVLLGVSTIFKDYQDTWVRISAQLKNFSAERLLLLLTLLRRVGCSHVKPLVLSPILPNLFFFENHSTITTRVNANRRVPIQYDWKVMWLPSKNTANWT